MPLAGFGPVPDVQFDVDALQMMPHPMCRDTQRNRYRLVGQPFVELLEDGYLSRREQRRSRLRLCGQSIRLSGRENVCPRETAAGFQLRDPCSIFTMRIANHPQTSETQLRPDITCLPGALDGAVQKVFASMRHRLCLY